MFWPESTKDVSDDENGVREHGSDEDPI